MYCYILQVYLQPDHIHLNYPLLFNDMIHSVMIYYCSPDAVEETTDSVEKQLTRFGIRSRIVTSQEALREKVSIFNADLDDRAVEILKQVLLIRAGDQLAGQNIQGVYFVPGEKPRVEVQLDNGGGHIPVDMSMYEKVLDIFSHVLTPESDKELFIDGAWASDVLTREPE